MHLLVAERGEVYGEFMQNLLQMVTPNPEEREARMQAFTEGAATILRDERAAIEALSYGWAPWSRFVAWLRQFGRWELRKRNGWRITQS
jgi:hypothetical protein